MAWSKKAAWTVSDVLFWFFYIPMTAIVVVVLVIYPENIFAVALQPMTLDSGLMAERVHYSLADYDQFIGVRDGFAAPGKLDEILTLRPSEKRYTIMVQRDGEVYFPGKLQKEFYEDALPIADIRYKKFDKNFSYTDLTGNPVKVSISQIFPKQYEKTRRT
jgi:hypothetical protein